MANEEKEVERLDVPGTEEPPVKVNLDEPDDDDKADDDATPVDPDRRAADGQPRDPSGKWAEKKAARGRDRREAQNWKTEKVEFERRIERIQQEGERRYAELQARLEQASRPAQRPADPFQAALADIETQLDQELRLIEADDKRGYKHYNALRQKEQRTIIQQEMAQAAAQQRQQPQQRDPYAARGPIIEAEYPWVQDRRYDELSRMAASYRHYLITVEGRPDTIETDREALSSIQAKRGAEFGLRPPAARPSDRTRSLYEGPPHRGTPDRGGGRREIELPAAFANGTGLTPAKLAAALRDQQE